MRFKGAIQLARPISDGGELNLKDVIANYDPEPDVVVVDVVLAPDQHYVDRFYLAAEVVSDSDASCPFLLTMLLEARIPALAATAAQG